MQTPFFPRPRSAPLRLCSCFTLELLECYKHYWYIYTFGIRSALSAENVTHVTVPSSQSWILRVHNTKNLGHTKNER